MRTRNEIQCRVLELVGLASAKIKIRGSWLYGDFHFDCKLNKSYSDIDLYCSSRHQAEVDCIAKLVKNKLACLGLDIPISIHTNTAMDEITLAAARELVLPEYLYQRYFLQTSSDVLRRSYIDAKFILLSLRRCVSERYLDVSRRIENDVGRHLLDVKMGNAKQFSVNKALHLLVGGQKRFASYLSLNEVSHSDVEKAIADINPILVNETLIRNIKRKYEKVSIGLCL